MGGWEIVDRAPEGKLQVKEWTEAPARESGKKEAVHWTGDRSFDCHSD